MYSEMCYTSKYDLTDFLFSHSWYICEFGKKNPVLFII